MTLPTLLTETAGYKLITLVRGRYGWNGPAHVHWFAEGAQPVVSLNPDGGYQTLSVKTWPVPNPSWRLALTEVGTYWNNVVVADDGLHIFAVDSYEDNDHGACHARLSSDGGATWPDVTPPGTTYSMYSCAISADGEVLVIGAGSKKLWVS